MGMLMRKFPERSNPTKVRNPTLDADGTTSCAEVPKTKKEKKVSKHEPMNAM